VPSFAFPESAAIALAHVTRYGEWLRQPVNTPAALPEDLRTAVRAIIERARADSRGWLSPAECESLLAAAGVPAVASRLARTEDEAVTGARAVGFPCVMKVVGTDIVHKTDVGGVRLGLASDDAVRKAFAALSVRLGNRLEAVLLQPMVSGGVEMVVGGLNDPAFGPVVMCGTGGVLVEVLDDTAFGMCPLGEAEAGALVARIKGRARLRGYRGAPAVDEAAFVRLLTRVSQVLHACPEIKEMELNPVIVLPAGAVVVDVRIRVGDAETAPPTRRIRH
jgi:acyl-CoA synthetase (NDP forming)